MPNSFINRKVVLSKVAPVASSYTEGAQAFFNALPTQPEARVKSAYNNMWVDYPAVQSLHDIQYLSVAEYEDNKRTNLITPASYYQTKISTPTFTQFMGVTGGAGKAYESPYIPSTNAVNISLTNVCFWFYNGSNVLFDVQRNLGSSVAGEGGMLSARLVPSVPLIRYSANGYEEYNTSVATNKSYYGLWSIVRSGNVVTIYKNGVLFGSPANHAPVALPNVSFYELAMNLGGVLTHPTTRQNFGMGVCANTVNQADLYNMVENYLGDLPLWSFYGDSIFYGYNAANPATDNPCILLSTLRGYYPFNRAIEGTTIKNFIDSTETIRRKGFLGQKILFDWGINDSVEALGTATYKTNYQAVIDAAIAAGWSVSDMVIIKQWYITEPGVLAVYPAYVTAAQEIATANGITNCFAFGTGAYTLSDTLHPNTAGYATIANYLNANII